MTTDIKNVNVRTSTAKDLIIGRLYTTDTADTFRLLLGPMDMLMIPTRTAAWAYFTEVDGVFFAAATGSALLRSVVAHFEDKPYNSMDVFSSVIANYLKPYWNNQIPFVVEDTTLNTTVLSSMADSIRIWGYINEYLESNIDSGNVFAYLNNNSVHEGDVYHIIHDYENRELRERAECYESDRVFALTRLCNHYFAIAIKMHSMKADPHDTARAVSAFLEFNEQLNGY